MPDDMQSCMDLPLRARLSVADAVVLVHRLGFTKTVQFISVVDPWCYPGEDTRAPILMYPYLQTALDKVTKAGKTFKEWTPESTKAYLCSPLLLQKGRRPELIRLSKAAHMADNEASGHLSDVTHVAAPGACPFPIFSHPHVVPNLCLCLCLTLSRPSTAGPPSS
jgi:hypothetical protein